MERAVAGLSVIGVGQNAVVVARDGIVMLRRLSPEE
jgi:hypothetical protein